ncbi:unnamed protein product [Parajaminaea phylloscopi]
MHAGGSGSRPPSSGDDDDPAAAHATPKGAHSELPPTLTRATSNRDTGSEGKNFDSDPRGNFQMNLDSHAGGASASTSRGASTVAQSPPRPTFSRLSTLPDQRILDDPQTRNRPLNQWRIPKSAKGSRAATLFLGKDYERWQIHDRDSLGVKLAWRTRPGSSSDIPLHAPGGGLSGEDDEGDSGAYSDASTTDAESEAGSSWGTSGRSSRRSSRSSRSRSNSGTWKRQGLFGNVAALQPLSATASGSPQGLRRGSEAIGTATSTASPSASSSSGNLSGAYSRPRRYSSNGPEAAFLRHETVIGLHTPRRDSASSSSSSFVSRQLPASMERISLAPLSQIKPSPSKSISPLPSGQASKIDTSSPATATSVDGDAVATSPQAAADHESVLEAKQSTTNLRRKESSFDLLKRAAEAAATFHDQSSESSRDVSRAPSPSPRSASPRSHSLTLARRRKPIRVEGTLYDRSGPFREGAVTDGLSVRLFSVERQEEEDGGYEDSPASESQQAAAVSAADRPRRGTHRRKRRVHRHEADEQKRARGLDSAIDDDDADVEASGRGNGRALVPKVKDAAAATTYLITTPDNRVSSAAKLRRWAMDGSGNFYAAMEIKSVEAKLRCAVDPKDAEANQNIAFTRSLAKILRQTYLDDILNEVQKAETLNPGRNSVSRLLVTGDNKYVRLEEDFPEETFFVIAGCEEEELYPVVALVFCQALRHIHRFHNAGWMHGDIKLENLMFDRRGHLVVIDYENANPFRVPGGDGCVALMSFDWVPPEAAAGPDGRRAGPSADLWALGANLVRAFALRDGIEDTHIRQILLEDDQTTFLRFRDSLVTVDETKVRASAEDVTLDPILDGAFAVSDDDHPGTDTNHHHHSSPGPGGLGNGSRGGGPGRHNRPTPARLLYYFARAAPQLLRYVLASCLTLSPSARGVEAELEGLQLAARIEGEDAGALIKVAKKAVETAIQLSGSEWVRPKLDEARKSLGLGADGEAQCGEDEIQPAVCVADDE